MYLQLRRRLWYALHEIPADVRPVLGKPRFCRSLETESKKTAERRAAILEQRWKREIEQARGKATDPLEDDARYWQRVLREAPEDEKSIIRDMISDEAQEMVERAAERVGITDWKDPAIYELAANEEAGRFYAIATGKLTRMDEHLDEWLATLSNEAKSKDMKKSTVLKFAETFPYVQDVRGKDVQRWVNTQTVDLGKGPATVRRYLSELRGYWKYLIALEVIPSDCLPFENLKMPEASKKAAGSNNWTPFAPGDVVKLLRAAEAKKDSALADLIRLGMWTGARIESLCILRVEDVADDHFNILDDKSPAGRRTVPIHPKLKPTMERLIKGAGEDGYVLPELTLNKYRDRSNAIGKRFGHLKTAKGFGPMHVFHSIRKTVATLLENAGVPENIAADIIGHDKPTMTYGLYSGGASLEVKRDALERISYPGMV